MALAGWVTALAVGLLAGAVSGLVGIGGGAIMVPFLYFFLSSGGLSGVTIPADQQAVVAHASSLLAIVAISLRGALLYGRAGMVEWHAVWRMGIASVIAAVVGARVAVAVPDEVLKATFGVFLIAMGLRMIVGKRRLGADASEPHGDMDTGRALAGGAAVGFFGALLGIGGGLVAIPVLIYGLHTPLRKVSGTSLALITFTSATGVVTYALSGGLESTAGLYGYFHLPAALSLAVGALVAVPLGTTAQMRMPTDKLRVMFAVLFLLLGLRILVSNLMNFFGR